MKKTFLQVSSYLFSHGLPIPVCGLCLEAGLELSFGFQGILKSMHHNWRAVGSPPEPAVLWACPIINQGQAVAGVARSLNITQMEAHFFNKKAT